MKAKVIQFLIFAVIWSLGFLGMQVLSGNGRALSVAHVAITFGCGVVGGVLFVAAISWLRRRG